MPRYKVIDTNPQFLAIDLAKQLLPGSFEHAVHHLVTHELDLTAFDARIQNDGTGATAYPPAMLLEVVLCAYAHGIVSSRAIARAGEDHVTFIALCGARAPHCTTIAHFVSTLSAPIATVFAGVLAVCDRQGLIGRTMFAIDGVKLPSNASKHRSGTRAAFAAQATKLEAAAKTMLARHRAEDAAPREPDLVAKDAARVATLERDATEIRTWLAAHPAIGGARPVVCARAIAPIMKAPRWRRRVACSKGTPASPPWMRPTRSLWRPRRSGPARSRSASCPWSPRRTRSAARIR